MPYTKAVPSEPKGPPSPDVTKSTSNARPRRRPREFLPSSVLEELWSIWQADPRVPSIKSRRLWAISRNANPRLVDGWFLRRKACAKKSGQPMPDGSYDLSLDPPIVSKREQSVTATEIEFDAVPGLPSDDTLVYPLDGDDLNDVEASSKTVFDESRIEPQKTESLAYKEIPQQQASHSEPSSGDLGAGADRFEEDTPSFHDPSLSVCNQGQGKSGFTCILCSEEPTRDEVPTESDAMVCLVQGELFTSCPCLDFLPDTLSELSAIPFLFRTPLTVLPDNANSLQDMGNWTSVEDELGRLVNDGELDFSFLDNPNLVSMELPD